MAITKIGTDALDDGAITTAKLASAVGTDILASPAITGNLTTNGLIDGVDIAARDAILTSTTTTADAALPKAGGAMTGAITTNSTFDGRDVAADGVTADAALPKAGGAMTGAITTNSTFDGVDIATRDALLTSTISDVALKATLASPSLTGVPVAPTAAGNTTTTQLATTAFVQQEITTLIGGAPSTLNDLNELANAINDDANYNSTLTTALALKATIANPALTGSFSSTGTATQDFTFETSSTNTRALITTKSKDASGNNVQVKVGSMGDGPYGMLYTLTNHNLTFGTNNSAPQMTLKTDGKVGIGISTPDSKLQVYNNTNTVNNVGSLGFDVSASIGNAATNPGNHYSSGLRLFQGSGSVGSGLGIFHIGVDNGTATADNNYTAQLAAPSGMTGGIKLTAFDSSGTIRFNTGGNTERMRIDSSGTLLVGEMANFIATSTTATGLAVIQDGRFTLSREGTPMNIGRLGSDGSLIDFWRQGSPVGSIGVGASEIFIGSNDAYWWTSGNNNAFLPASTAIGGASNGLLDLGSSGRRFKSLYLNTSISMGGTTILDGARNLTNINNITSTNTISAVTANISGTATIPKIMITAASAADTVTLTRGTTAHNNMLKFITGSTADWIVGERNDSTSNFRIYSYGTASDVFSIDRATGQVAIGTTNPTAGTHTKLEVHGAIAAGSAQGTGGSLVLFQRYGVNDMPATLSTHYSHAGWLLATGMKARAGAPGYVSSLGNYSTARAGIDITGTDISYRYVSGATVAVDTVVTPTTPLNMNLVTSNLEVTGGAPTLTLNASGQATNKKKVRIAVSQYTAGDFNIQQMNDAGTSIVLNALQVNNGGELVVAGPIRVDNNYMTIDGDFGTWQGRYQHLTCHNTITASNTWTDVAYVSYSPSLTIQGTSVRDNSGAYGMASYFGTIFGGYGSVTVTATTNIASSMNGAGFGQIEYRYLNGGASSGNYRLQVRQAITSGTMYITTTLTGQAFQQITED